MPNTLLNKDPSAMAVALIAFIVISGIPDVCHSRIVPPGIQDYNINHLDNSIDDKPEKTEGEPSWGYSKADGPHTWPRYVIRSFAVQKIRDFSFSCKTKKTGLTTGLSFVHLTRYTITLSNNRKN